MTLLLLLLPAYLYAQYTITGKVINASDKTPVPFASVFLSNSLVGGKTADDGSFTLNNVKAGQYDMVISFIGFETHHQIITITGSNLALGNIEITPKSTQLKEVTIGADLNRERNIESFLQEFLGRSENAQNCKILNPELINISFDNTTRVLEASSDDFLIIENKALGYKIRYQLNKFTKDYRSNMLYYEGSVLFENLPGKPAQQRRWEKNRLEVYKGSDMHFLRSIFADKLDAEGFKVLRLIRKPNPARPADSLILVKIRTFRLFDKKHPEWVDSADYWRKKQQLPKQVEYLVKQPRPLNDYVAHTDVNTMLALRFTDYLYVIYTKRHDSGSNGQLYHPVDVPDYPTSVISLNKAYAIFDSNGIFLDPTSFTYEGAWGLSRVADLLPVDYEPLISKP